MTDGTRAGCPEPTLRIAEKACLSYAPYDALEVSAFCRLTPFLSSLFCSEILPAILMSSPPVNSAVPQAKQKSLLPAQCSFRSSIICCLMGNVYMLSQTCQQVSMWATSAADTHQHTSTEPLNHDDSLLCCYPRLALQTVHTALPNHHLFSLEHCIVAQTTARTKKHCPSYLASPHLCSPPASFTPVPKEMQFSWAGLGSDGTAERAALLQSGSSLKAGLLMWWWASGKGLSAASLIQKKIKSKWLSIKCVWLGVTERKKMLFHVTF